MSDYPPESAGLPERALYTATKCAVPSLSRATAADLLPSPIRGGLFISRHR